MFKLLSKTKLKLCFLFFLPLAWLCNTLFSLYPYEAEAIYSSALNKWFIQALSHFTSFVPFSLAECIIYGVVIALIFYFLYLIVTCIRSPHHWLQLLCQALLTLMAILSTTYFIFVISWGLNYHRPAFGGEAGIYVSQHTGNELADLYHYLILKANETRPYTQEDEQGYMRVNEDKIEAFERATLGYEELTIQFPSLSGSYGNPKPILTSHWMNYSGITGVYFPFTGEANVNTAILDMSLPATLTHEMAHQRGYASEDECNFIAYLACTAHPDKDYNYSGYMLALAYTGTALSKENPTYLKELNQYISPKVRQDILHSNAFWQQYEGKVAQVASAVNHTYLKANGIADGEKSYGRMVDLLLSYYTLYLK